MKPLRQTHKRIFTRSLYTPTGNGSLPLGFFDTPPSTSRSSQRLSIETTPRASGESHWQHSQSNNSANGTANPGSHPPYSLALPTTHATLRNGSHFSSSSGAGSNGNPLSIGVLPSSGSNSVPVTSDDGTASSSTGRPRKRPRLDPQYVLDVGACGIPKRRHTSRPAHTETRRHIHTPAFDSETPLSVQVGEDAYFISERGNAMGVADGVGGWSRHMTPEIAKHTPGTTPSALFAKRLMHYCAVEAAEALGTLHMPLTSPGPTPPPPLQEIPIVPSLPRPWRTTNPYFQPCHPHPIPILDQHTALPYSHPNNSIGSTSLPSAPKQMEQWQEELDESMEDLADGLDVLSIMSSGVDTTRLMERALHKTLDAHTIPAPLPVHNTPPNAERQGNVVTSAATEVPVEAEMVPLMAGSSTALIAVLDHVLLPEEENGMNVDVQMSSSPLSASPLSASPLTTIHVPRPGQLKNDQEPTAVIKIAHVGDSMGMLIREDAIVWRSQEMWVQFNTPLQLSPLPGAPNPTQAAQVAQLRVKNGDILILASDGLSDNLWDEEILDEVLKVRADFQAKMPGPSTSSTDKPVLESDVLNMLRRQHGSPTQNNLASVLSEALCSRAKSVCDGRSRKAKAGEQTSAQEERWGRDTPFAKRAKDHGKHFKGGKPDDISVIVAVISPVAARKSATPESTS